MTSRMVSLLVAAAVAGATVGLVRTTTESRPSAAPASATGVAAREAVPAGLGGMPVSFVANQGRWDDRASWVASGPEATAYFVESGVRWALPGHGVRPGWALDQALVAARPGRATASAAAPGVVSYFGGENPSAAMPTATELTLTEAWPGVDVVWSGTGGRVEATYRLAPGADPAQVRVAWRGADGIAVTGDGRLSVTTPVRTFEEDAPKAFQDIAGRRVAVDVAFDLDGAGSYGFRLGSYDPALALVIDPPTLLYASFLGGRGDDDLGRGTQWTAPATPTSPAGRTRRLLPSPRRPGPSSPATPDSTTCSWPR